ncbi:MAG TPA: response regulator transcription factor [Steroidobacteraceae bacterium]|nr:response regulator transcription factor [Steroidobacteraceae bacterium]
MIRVFLVEDHAIVREGLSNLLALSGDVDVIGAAACAADALTEVPAAKPDVLLLDIKLPDFSGVELIRRLQTRNELPPTLILTTFEDDELLFEGLRAGARGYLLKDISLEQLLEAIREIAHGGNYVKPAITERLLQAARKGESLSRDTPALLPLTERETHVLRLLASGYSNREIASALVVSVGTVKNHVSSILGKLGVRDRTRAVLKGLQTGLL